MTPAAAEYPAEAAEALLGELREVVLRLLGERLTRMFDGADDLLFEMSNKAGTNEQQRVYFDAMRLMRLSRARISEAFGLRLLERFTAAPVVRPDLSAVDVDFDSLKLQDSDHVEETIAISNMAGKAAATYGSLLWELERRLEWLSDHSPAHVPAEAVSPAGFCEAFRDSLQGIDFEFSTKLVLYKLFDRLVLGDLKTLYVDVLALLVRYHIEMDKLAPVRAPELRPEPEPATPEPVPPSPAPGASPAEPAPTAPPNEAADRREPPAAAASAPQPQPQVPISPVGASQALDPQTLGVLQQYRMLPPQGPSSEHYAAGGYPGYGAGDAELAAELIAAARGQGVPGLDPGRAWAMTQRAGLVGRMFNEIVADPTLPRSVSAALEELRFPVIKTALSDISFFSNPQHPVRTLINDLASMAAATRADGPEAVARFEVLVRRVKDQFDIDAESVRPRAREAKPLGEGDVERFIDDQMSQGRERRKVVVEKVRKVVAQELELQTMSQPVPDVLQPLLRSGWGPMMAMRLLRHGQDSDVWRAGMELLHRVLFALNPNSPNARTPAEREALRRDLASALSEVGMSQDRIDSLVRGLDHALNEIEPAPPAPAEAASAPAPGEAAAEGAAPGSAPGVPAEEVSTGLLLDRLLVPGSWFRVYDRANRDTRWLKLMSWYPQTQRVSFAEFDGNNALTLHTRDLVEDLLIGRSEPIDTSPTALQLLEQLRQSHAAPAEAAVS